MLGVAASLSDAVKHAVVGPDAAVELQLELELVHDVVQRVVDCWLLKTLCQRGAIKSLLFKVNNQHSGTRLSNEQTE